MPVHEQRIIDEAIGWRIRLAGHAADWDAFMTWLEADPRHNAAYEAVAQADREAPELLPSPVPSEPATAVANDNAPVDRRRRRLLWSGAIAAALVALAAGLPQLFELQSATIATITAPGEQRTLRLADGSEIAVNGGSRLVQPRDNPRVAMLERGEASFTIVHDPARQFEVRIGDARVVDVGTRFNIDRSDGAVAIEVAEGAVVYNPDREAVRVGAGEFLRVDNAAQRLVRGRLQAADVASWRDGRLVFRDATFEEVGRSLTRNLGVDVTIDPSLAGSRFSGVLRIDGDKKAVSERIARVLDVRMTEEGKAWRLASRHREAG